MPPPSVTKAGYKRYIKSPQWAAVKRRYRESKLPQDCRVCGARRVDLHHRTYDHLGHEPLRDLVPLCRADHQALHGLQRALRVNVTVATAMYLKGARIEAPMRTVRKPPKRRAPRRRRKVA